MTPFSPDFGNDVGTRVWSIIWTPAAIFSPRPQTARPVDVEPEEPVSFGAAFASFFAMALIPAAIIAFIACGIMKGHMKTARPGGKRRSVYDQRRAAEGADGPLPPLHHAAYPLAPPPSSNHRPSGGYRGGTTVNSRGFSGSSRKF